MKESIRLSDFPGVPNFKFTMPGLYSSGQPETAHWQALHRAGLRSVINLCPAYEQPDQDEAKNVGCAGLAYAHLPIAGGSDLGPESAAALDGCLRELPAPVLVHCASGNRVGALMALREAWVVGAPVAQALETGRRAGMTGLEAQVRQQLGLDPA